MPRIKIKNNLKIFMYLSNIISQRKYKFLFYGIINVAVTNVCLQILLFFYSPIKATLISQTLNFFIGYYFYGTKVFLNKNWRLKILLKYLILVIFLWNLNWLLIELFHSFGLSKNLASIIIVPLLALLSYLSQKYIVFRNFI